MPPGPDMLLQGVGKWTGADSCLTQQRKGPELQVLIATDLHRAMQGQACDLPWSPAVQRSGLAAWCGHVFEPLKATQQQELAGQACWDMHSAGSTVSLQIEVGMDPPAEVARSTRAAGLDVPVLAEFVLLATCPHFLGGKSVRIDHVLLAIVLAADAQQRSVPVQACSASWVLSFWPH